MSREDNISKIFLDNEHKLNERPPAMAWGRLEEKLEERSSGQRKTIYKQLFAIAAMLLVVSTVMLFTLFDGGNQQNVMAALEEEPAESPIAFGNEADSKPPRPILMSHKEKVYYKNMDLIAENKSPSKNVRKENIEVEIADKAIAENRSPITFNKKIEDVDVDDFTPTSEERKVEVQEKVDKITALKEEQKTPVFKPSQPAVVKPEALKQAPAAPVVVAPAPTLAPSKKTMTMNTTGAVADMIEEESLELETISKEDLPVAEDLKDKYAPEDNIGYSTASEITVNEIAAEKALGKAKHDELPWKKKEVESRKRKAAQKAEMEAKSKARSAPSLAESAAYMDREIDDNFQSIDLFNWLIGDWKDVSGASIERWTKLGGKKLSGKGYLLSNGKPIFSENMLIQQIGGKLYFVATLELGKDPVYLKLDSYDNSKAVFMNEDRTFPKSIVIHKLSNNSFEISINAETINTIQENFLSNRNLVLPTNATRNLIRSNE